VTKENVFSSDNTDPSKWGDLKGDDCDMYTKTVLDSSIEHHSLSNVFEIIHSFVEKGQFKFELFPKRLSFLAVEVETNLSPFDERSKGAMFTVGYNDHGIKTTNSSTAKEVVSNDLMTLGDCYRACRDAEETCASFAYCPAKRDVKCVISTLYISSSRIVEKDIQDAITTDTQCTIYNVNYLNMFKKADCKEVFGNGKEMQENILTPEQCALHCRHDEHKLMDKCRSFNYCSDTKKCIMFDVHASETDKPVENKTDLCEHYSLKRSADYVNGGKGLMVDPDAQTSTSTSEENCADVCSLLSEGTCNSFSFCPGERRCITSQLFPDGKTEIVHDTLCNLYYRDAVVNDVIKPKNRGRPVITKDGMAPGGLAGLLITMLIVGCVLGVVGMIYFPSIRSRLGGASATTTAGPTIGYSVQKDDA